MKKINISIVIPVYGCKRHLKKLYNKLSVTLSSIACSYEIIMINDTSPDNAWETIRLLSFQDKRIIGINLSRNFGQHYAIMAGLDYAQGEWIVVMDCDLQDRPEEILNLYNKAQEGYDIVFGKRKNRQDSFLKKSGSKIFYKLLGYLTDTKQDAEVANFGIYNKKSIDAVLSMNDKLKYFPVMIKWVGFRETSIDIKHSSREEGKSAYTFSKLLSLSLDVMLSFSDKPLKIFVKLGFIISSISFLFSLIILIKAIFMDYSVPGWASMMISLWFLGGLIIIVLGIVGIYVGKTFNQTKDRPTYIIQEMTMDSL